MTGAEQVNWDSFAPITIHDHAGYIWIAVLDCMIVSALVLATRTWIKKNSWGPDDTLFAAAFRSIKLAQIGHAVALFVALKHGLGSIPSDSGDLSSASNLPKHSGYALGGRASFAADILMILTLAAAKCSVVLFIMRLIARDQIRLLRGCYVLFGLIAAWAVAAIVAFSVDCAPNNFLTNASSSQCSGRGPKWAGVGAFDAATELLLVALPVALVWPLQMKTRLKAQVVSAFMFRICVAGLAVMHAVYVSDYEEHSPPSLAMVRAIVVAEVEICWSLVSAAIPNLKNFLKSFGTGFGHQFGIGVTSLSGYINSQSHSGAFHGNGIPLSNVSRKQSRTDQPVYYPDAFGGNDTSYHTQVSTTLPEDTHSVVSGTSSEMIIRKNVVTTVEHSRR
ncbi:hypothetical protein LTR37_016268 [Vermiconidia calcicola]|uniref:Uncharacterized protein n=1 Tax=Vermiconidia calcicola TaxID=1690605 RepID=A0ACC3MNA6_9PEZI|nr:hypothetical protein LTR37_016268 [Vermiconidia calcicola]